MGRDFYIAYVKRKRIMFKQMSRYSRVRVGLSHDLSTMGLQDITYRWMSGRTHSKREPFAANFKVNVAIQKMHVVN